MTDTPNQKRRYAKYLGALLLFLACCVTFVYVQRYTTYGIFLLGGSRYWVHRAALETNDEQAKAYLQRVLNATQYGVNKAETLVIGLRYQSDAYRLSILLSEIAPNDNWKKRYLALAKRFEDRTPKGDFDIYN